jgi:DNA-binding FrmR family transcriptional regulator
MAHLVRERDKLLNRVRRIRGQIDAIERNLEQEGDCSMILHTIAACRGAIDGLMNEVLEGHIRTHLIDTRQHPTPEQIEAAEDLIDLVKSYLK